MRILKSLLAGSVLVSFSFSQAAANEAMGTLTVLELFTSQACPNAPEGDKNIAKLASREGVLALTYPVTYWDYLGWEDSLAHKKFDDRQRNYLSRFQDKWPYTPQVVIQGTREVNGESLAALEEGITTALQSSPRSSMPVSWEGDATLRFSQSPLSGNNTGNQSLSVVFYHAGAIPVEIKSGKNAGKTVTYTNVVQEILEPTSELMPIPENLNSLECAILLQDRETGRIVEARHCPVRD